jgi:fermentation-respiration switch protein FrsA (DUF1100 family)
MGFNTYLVVLIGGLVLLAGYLGFISTRVFVWLALGGAIAGSLMLLFTPTPRGYDPNVMSHGITSAVDGQRIAVILFALSGAAFVNLAGFHRPHHDDADWTR